jgi:chromosomal replication initiation ATPase DnaA
LAAIDPNSSPRPTSAALPAARAAVPVPLAALREAGSDLVLELWDGIQSAALAANPDGALAHWLARLEPLALREGVFVVATRSSRAAPSLRERLEPLLERAARTVLGGPVRVRIEVDQSLGGALRALGVRAASSGPPPPPFLVRSETRLAHSAVLRMAREPAPEFDQIVLEGPAGVGKSLLMQTFLHQRRRRFPRERWRLERAEGFFREFSSACRDQARATFRGERVACDGLLLDDVQELSGKLACQEQLVEILEYLRAHSRPVLIAGEPLPGGPREFLPALRARLRGGLRLAIPQLSAATRAELLACKARVRGLDGLVAQLAAATERPLAECMKALALAERLALQLRRAPRPEELAEALGPLLPSGSRPDPMDLVLDRCAGFVGVSRELLVGGARTRSAALGRHLAVYLAVEVFGLQRATVKRWLGSLSPSVAPYVKGKIDALRAEDRRLDGFLREVTEEVGRGQRFLFG